MTFAPSLYEYYTNGGIESGLNYTNQNFILNNKEIVLYSGALHYFRVPQQYWRDRLKKLKAAGLNTVETYVPWNLHEAQPGVYDFGNGGSDFEEFLNLKLFLETAKEEDLFAIVRPGPYICAEWEFGGMPSWLLREKDIKLRTADEKFMKHVERYFRVLLGILALLQFTKGGPIIAFQIENEYGNVYKENDAIDKTYLKELKKIYDENGLVELYFTSDTPSIGGTKGSLQNILYTANFQNNSLQELKLLNEIQNNKPSMVMEYWSGWFDHWGEVHHTRSDKAFEIELKNILSYPSSVNFYMFHGGTNWGFMNGANVLDNSTDSGGITFDTTSYDYDAPLTESGDYTNKYKIIKNLIKNYSKINITISEMPKETKKIKHSKISITHMITLNQLIKQTQNSFKSENLIPMEFLNINNNSGQSYGYIVYRKIGIDIPPNSILKINGRVCDTVMVLINGILKSPIYKTNEDLNKFGTWRIKDNQMIIQEEFKNATLDLIVENWGRNNFGKLDQFNQKKGLWQGNVSLNNINIYDWNIYPLEFKKSFNNNLKQWENYKKDYVGPAIYKGILSIHSINGDTFIDMSKWTKGIVIVNGFVLSRYFRPGPQQTAYLPAPFLHKGKNEILIFEHFINDRFIQFSDKLIFKNQ